MSFYSLDSQNTSSVGYGWDTSASSSVQYPSPSTYTGYSTTQYTGNQTTQSYAQQPQGYGQEYSQQSTQGFGQSSTPGYGQQASQGYGQQASQGYGQQSSQSYDQSAQGYGQQSQPSHSQTYPNQESSVPKTATGYNAGHTFGASDKKSWSSSGSVKSFGSERGRGRGRETRGRSRGTRGRGRGETFSFGQGGGSGRGDSQGRGRSSGRGSRGRGGAEGRGGGRGRGGSDRGRGGMKTFLRGSTEQMSTTKPFMAYKCDLCNASMTGLVTYTSHIEGQKHKQAVKNKELGLSTAASDPVNPSNKFKCELCNIFVSGPSLLQSHYAGAKHKKKMQETGAQGPTAELGEIKEISLQNTPISNLIKPPYISSEERPWLMNIMDQASEPIIGLDYVTEIVWTDHNIQPRYLCTLCDNKANCQSVFFHIIGFKHRINYIKRHGSWEAKNKVATPMQGQGKQGKLTAEAQAAAQMVERERGRGMPKVRVESDPNFLKDFQNTGTQHIVTKQSAATSNEVPSAKAPGVANTAGRFTWQPAKPVKILKHPAFKQPAVAKGSDDTPSVFPVSAPDTPYASVQQQLSFYPTLTSEPQSLNWCKNMTEPIVGLGFIYEFHKEAPTDVVPRVFCALCESKLECNSFLCHVVGQKHRLKYLKLTCSDIVARHGGANQSAEQLMKMAREAEKRDGRGVPTVKLDNIGLIEAYSKTKGIDPTAVQIAKKVLDEQANLDPEEKKALEEKKAAARAERAAEKGERPEGLKSEEYREEDLTNQNITAGLMQLRTKTEGKPWFSRFLSTITEPIIGLGDVLEIQHNEGGMEPRYWCCLCFAKNDPRTLQAHATGMKHRMKYFQKHSPEKFQELAKLERDNRQEKVTLSKKYAAEVETEKGRELPVMKVDDKGGILENFVMFKGIDFNQLALSEGAEKKRAKVALQWQQPRMPMRGRGRATSLTAGRGRATSLTAGRGRAGLRAPGRGMAAAGLGLAPRGRGRGMRGRGRGAGMAAMQQQQSFSFGSGASNSWQHEDTSFAEDYTGDGTDFRAFDTPPAHMSRKRPAGPGFGYGMRGGFHPAAPGMKRHRMEVPFPRFGGEEEWYGEEGYEEGYGGAAYMNPGGYRPKPVLRAPGSAPGSYRPRGPAGVGRGSAPGSYVPPAAEAGQGKSGGAAGNLSELFDKNKTPEEMEQLIEKMVQSDKDADVALQVSNTLTRALINYRLKHLGEGTADDESVKNLQESINPKVEETTE